MNKMKVAVIAGTCVDTQMGVEFLILKGEIGRAHV